MQDRPKRLIINIVISYYVVSVMLFAVFILVYRTYFYGVQHQAVISKARQREEVNLRIAQQPFLYAHAKGVVTEQAHLDTLKLWGEQRLGDLVEGLEALSVPEDTGLLEPSEPEGPSFIETADESRDRLEALLKPVSKSEGEQAFLRYFNNFNEKTEGNIAFRLFSNGMEQVVSMRWVYIDNRSLQLRDADGKTYDWEIRAYAIPKRHKEMKMDRVVEELLVDHKAFVQRLAIFRYEEPVPLFQGQENKVTPDQLSYYEDRAKAKGSLLFESPPGIPLSGFTMGVEMDKLKLLSFLSDPDLGLTFVMERDVYEYEWTQFSFFNRNKAPIFVYVGLAWVICPLLFWIGIRRASSFRFQFTADLDGDDDGGLDLTAPANSEAPIEALGLPPEAKELSPKEGRSTESSPTKPQETSSEDEGEEIPPVVEAEIPAELPTVEEPTRTEPLVPFSERDPEPPPVAHHARLDSPLDLSDVEAIRRSNMQKSSGEFNRHRDEEQDVDYLAGVQSDVLKSLIKKLRDK